MRERHIFWDIAVVGLLGMVAVFNGIVLLQNNNLEKLLIEQNKRSNEISSQNRDILGRLDRGLKVDTRSGTGDPDKVAGNLPFTPLGGTLYTERDVPKFVHGDENAEDGGTLYRHMGSEPNSLNTIVESDATLTDYVFSFCVDTLASRSFDDFKVWEPKLAQAWEKSMICRGLVGKKNARELADKLNAALKDADRSRLHISKISAENDEILRIELGDVDGSYRDEVQKILGENAVDKQFWIYVSFEGEKFSDGTEINAKTVGERLEGVIQKAGVSARILPRWQRENSVVIQVAGDGAGAEKAIRDYIATDANKGEIIDPKSSTGKRTDKVLTFDITEEYAFEEKPVFTFHLRRDVKWHDGAPFTGKDVIFSFNAMMNPKVEAASQRNYLQDVESCKLVNDDYTVQFVWKKPYFLAFNFAAGIDILPEHLFKFTDPEQFNKGEQNQRLIGNGPYRLERWDRKQQFVLVRNEDYYDKKPHFKKIVIRIVQDDTVALQMLQAGDLDLLSLNKSQAKDKSADPKFTSRFNINVSVANVYRYIGWNARLPMFGNPKVRKALTMLVDRQRVIDDIYRGYALPLHGPSHPDSPNYTPEINKFAVPYDPAAAAKVLAEEGWKDTNGDNVLDKDGKPFKFNLLFASGSPQYEQLANLVKNTFAQVGIEVIVAPLEWTVFIQKIERLQFDACILGWRLGLEDDPYQLWHSSQTGEKASNHCGFVNKEADRLIEMGRRELNEEKRRKIFQRFQQIIAEQQPYTFLFVEKRTIAVNKDIQNVVYKLPGADIGRWWMPKAKQKN
ncbi:MAG TPA: peptide-binding protein [Planctomycetota bacterium]|nr:peptide-binding protein [Planctomycetota bacterium]